MPPPTNYEMAFNYGMAFNALGDPTRRAIFEKLSEKPLSVAQIADGLPVSRPAVSQHLKVLRDAKLIRIYPMGTRNFHQIDFDGIYIMRNYLDKLWAGALTAFKATAEKENKNI